MLSRRQTVVIALFACLVAGFGWLDRASSLPPPHDHAVSASQGSTNSSANQKQPAKSLGQRLSIVWNRTWEDPVAFYTFVLSVFTGLLAIVSAFQIFFLIRADKTARRSANAAIEAANAAKRNADALISAERAHLYAVIEGSNLQDSIAPVTMYNFGNRAEGGTWDDDTFISTRPAVRFLLKNLGKTPAVVTEIGYQLIQGVEGQRVWEHEIPLATLVRPVIDGSAQSEAVDCGLRDSGFNVGAAKAAMDGTRPLYFYGHVAFIDSFNRRYTYFWRYQNMGITFVMVRSEEQPEQDGGE